MTKPDTIIRFHKPTAENMESIEKLYIFLFSASQWKDAGEMQFEVDLSNPTALREFVTEEVEKAFSFSKETEDYNRYFGYRHDLLNRHGRINVLTSEQEKAHLVELSLKEIYSEKIKESKKGLVRNNFFSRTGVSCFTANKNTVEDRFHWLAFAEGGEGFCVEYDWNILEKHFSQTETGIRGDYIKYDQKNRPKLILQSSYSQAVMKNYCDIIFSLSQLMQDEKEFRLAKVYKDDMADRDDRRKEQIPQDAIKTIFLGSRMLLVHKEKLLGIVKAKLPAINVMIIHESGGAYKAIPLDAK